jgi:hypothetical protein
MRWWMALLFIAALNSPAAAWDYCYTSEIDPQVTIVVRDGELERSDGQETITMTTMGAGTGIPFAEATEPAFLSLPTTIDSLSSMASRCRSMTGRSPAVPCRNRNGRSWPRRRATSCQPMRVHDALRCRIVVDQQPVAAAHGLGHRRSKDGRNVSASAITGCIYSSF